MLYFPWPILFQLYTMALQGDPRLVVLDTLPTAVPYY